MLSQCNARISVEDSRSTLPKQCTEKVSLSLTDTVASPDRCNINNCIVRKSWPYVRPLTVIWTDMGLVRVRINPLIREHMIFSRTSEESCDSSLYLHLNTCLQLLMHDDLQRNDNSTHPWCTFCQIYPRPCISPSEYLFCLNLPPFYLHLLRARAKQSGDSFPRWARAHCGMLQK